MSAGFIAEDFQSCFETLLLSLPFPCLACTHPRNPKSQKGLFVKGMVGGAERDRTADLLIANEALSQLSYGPMTVIARYGGDGGQK